MNARATRGWELSEVFILRHAGFPFDWVESLGVSDALTSEIDAWIAGGRAASELPSLERDFDAEVVKLRAKLHAIARDPKVGEAVFLSSPDMFENVWARYAENAIRAENADVRRVERQVYAYVQRLCAKNETTSFFGPMGYGEIEGEDDLIELLPARLPPRRRTFIAYWAVLALGEAAARSESIWHQLPLRRNPLFAIDATEKRARCDSLDRVESLTDEELRLALATNESSEPKTLATLAGLSEERFSDVALSLMERLVLVRRFFVRSDSPVTLDLLRFEIERLAPTEDTRHWLRKLAELDGLRAKFEVAELPQRRTLLAEMDALFAALTSESPRRAGGRLYTDRLVLNEEASSPHRVRIGKKAAARLSRALSPLLDLSAAYGDKLTEASKAAVTALLGAQTHLSLPRYLTLAREAHAAPKEIAPLVGAGDAKVELARDAWGPPPDGPRFALPDVCLGKMPDGSMHVTLARMHHHLLTPGWLFTFYDDAQKRDRVASRFLEANASALPLVELASGRHNKGYYTFPGPRVAYANAEMAERPHATFCAADLTVSIDARGPQLHAPDGSRKLLYFPLADLTTHPPMAALGAGIVAKAEIATSSACSPRVNIDGATYQRRKWAIEMPSLRARTPFARFLAMQVEARRLGLPRFVFARVPSERKPFLVDTRSPFAVELLRHHLREDPRVTLEEMLPAPDELFLRDETGARYTFELRMQATRAAAAE